MRSACANRRLLDVPRGAIQIGLIRLPQLRVELGQCHGNAVLLSHSVPPGYALHAPQTCLKTRRKLPPSTLEMSAPVSTHAWPCRWRRPRVGSDRRYRRGSGTAAVDSAPASTRRCPRSAGIRPRPASNSRYPDDVIDTHEIDHVIEMSKQVFDGRSDRVPAHEKAGYPFSPTTPPLFAAPRICSSVNCADDRTMPSRWSD